MNDLMTFNNPDFGEIRTIAIDDQPWFVGKDIATALDYSNPQKAIRDHVDNEDKGVNDSFTPGGKQKLTIINESGLYSLILSSKLPTAKKFKRWVTAEVLPAIRQTGQYKIISAPNSELPERALTTDDYLKAASIVATCRNERLPYVLHYLERGGFDPPDIPSDSSVGSPTQAVRLIHDARTKYGLSCIQIGQITGLDRVQISRYLNGGALPKERRAACVIERLENAIAQISETST